MQTVRLSIIVAPIGRRRLNLEPGSEEITLVREGLDVVNDIRWNTKHST